MGFLCCVCVCVALLYFSVGLGSFGVLVFLKTDGGNAFPIH